MMLTLENKVPPEPREIDLSECADALQTLRTMIPEAGTGEMCALRLVAGMAGAGWSIIVRRRVPGWVVES
jgi:hypothetical protein